MGKPSLMFILLEQHVGEEASQPRPRNPDMKHEKVPNPPGPRIQILQTFQALQNTSFTGFTSESSWCRPFLSFPMAGYRAE